MEVKFAESKERITYEESPFEDDVFDQNFSVPDSYQQGKRFSFVRTEGEPDIVKVVPSNMVEQFEFRGEIYKFFQEGCEIATIEDVERKELDKPDQ